MFHSGDGRQSPGVLLEFSLQAREFRAQARLLIPAPLMLLGRGVRGVLALPVL